MMRELQTRPAFVNGAMSSRELDNSSACLAESRVLISLSVEAVNLPNGLCTTAKVRHKYTTSRVHVVRREADKDPSNVHVQYIWPEVWSKMSKKSRQERKQHWAKEKPKLDNTRKMTGMSCFDLDDKEIVRNQENARNDVEL